MAILIGHSSIDEHGNGTGGTAGDQTGKEVCTRTWYYGQWQYVLRCKDEIKAEKMASACEKGCANDNIGYDMSQRNTLYTYAKSVNYDLSQIKTPCECDCSSFMTICALAAGINITYGSNAPTTSTMKSIFSATGEFDVLTDTKYLTTDAYLKRGDILVKAGNHTVMALGNGSSVTSVTTTTSGSSSNTIAVNATYKVYAGGKWYPEVQNLNDYAGDAKNAIRGVAIKVDKGSIKYRVHIKGGSWYPYVTGYNTSDIVNGYAGDCKKDIDAIEVYYITPSGYTFKKAKYRVAPIGCNYYEWQYDNETENGQDGYAGLFGKTFGKFQLVIE